MTGGERRTQPDCIRLAIKTGIANHCCSANLKEEMLLRKTNPQDASMGHVDFTRGWHTPLSLPRTTSPPPRCLSPHHPCLHCQEPRAEHPSQGNATSQGRRMQTHPGRGESGSWATPKYELSPGACPYPAPSPSHPNSAPRSAWARQGKKMGWIGTLGPIPRIYKRDLPARGHPHLRQSQPGL